MTRRIRHGGRTVRPVLLALACIAFAGSASADVVGTGIQDLLVDQTGGTPPFPFSGTIVFDNATHDLFGTPVNLGTELGGGDMITNPNCLVPFATPVNV